MRIGLEVSSVVASQRSGVGNYVANMLTGLQKIAATQPDLDLLYFSNRLDQLQTNQLIRLDPAEIYNRDRLPIRTLWMQLGLPRSLQRTQPDLCHFPNYLAPVLRPLDLPYLVTLYDMSIYRCAEYLPFKTLAVHQAIVPKAANTAQLIITISESARQDILHYLKVPPEKVRVVHGSIGAHFHSESLRITSGQTFADDAKLQQRYGLDFPYILSVGTLEPRKNQARLVEAFTRLVQQEHLPHHLVLVGAHGWKEGPLFQQLQRCGLLERVHFLGYVPAADLPAIYRKSAVFAFPSLYEGFGLPILEAMACDTPCLISSDPALMEVAGGAALIVNPYSIEDIADGLYQLLTQPRYTQTLRQQGLARTANFTWERCAAETHQLYREALQEGTGPRFFVTSAADSATSFPADNQPMSSVYDQPEASSAIEASPLEQAILQTVLYSDIFNFPLNLNEIQHFLIGQSSSLNEIAHCLAESAYLKQRLAQQTAYFCLRNREEIFGYRLEQAATVTRHWQLAKRWCQVLQWIPFVRSAIVTGSLAAGSARPNDDIDLLLLVEPGRLWLCRALIIGVVHLARLSGLELCPNYLMAVTDSALTIHEHNLYTAREFASMRLMFGTAAYQKLLELNQWTEKWLPNTPSYLRQQTALLETKRNGKLRNWVRGWGEKLLSGKLGERLERWEQRKIAGFSHQEGAEARFTADVCKGHFGNYGTTTLTTFAQRCAIITQPASSHT